MDVVAWYVHGCGGSVWECGGSVWGCGDSPWGMQWLSIDKFKLVFSLRTWLLSIWGAMAQYWVCDCSVWVAFDVQVSCGFC